MANYIVQKESLEIVADSIRAKTGVSEKLEFPYGWKVAVDGIQLGGIGTGGLAAFASAVGSIPSVPVGLANSGFNTATFLFTTSATGAALGG